VPSTTVYIDDAPRNVEAARTLGFEALHFQDPGTLRRELVELDLLPPTASSVHAR
jgi:2-haloacid dehalogenase